ncbi:hypothetical protein WAI453_001026 [Rhynchosporium graminicola]
MLRSFKKTLPSLLEKQAGLAARPIPCSTGDFIPPTSTSMQATDQPLKDLLLLPLDNTGETLLSLPPLPLVSVSEPQIYTQDSTPSYSGSSGRDLGFLHMIARFCGFRGSTRNRGQIKMSHPHHTQAAWTRSIITTYHMIDYSKIRRKAFSCSGTIVIIWSTLRDLAAHDTHLCTYTNMFISRRLSVDASAASNSLPT